MAGDQPTPPTGNTSLRRLIQFFIELALKKTFCTVTITVQAGQITLVRVDQSYKLHDLPVADTSQLNEP